MSEINIIEEEIKELNKALKTRTNYKEEKLSK